MKTAVERIVFGGNLVWALLLTSLCATRVHAADRPNFVFILADDLGWKDVGFNGSTFYETPNLDRLAREGMRFTDAYAACSVCSPTRASIMTGKYPARLHLTDWLPGRPDKPDQILKHPKIITELPAAEITLAKALQEGGYKTAFIGKWHLGGLGHWPEQAGFDINIGGCGMGHPSSYFSPYKNPTLKDGPVGEYLADRLTDEAVKFIENTKGTPFLLYLSHYSVHTPLQAKKGLIEKYQKKVMQLPPTKGPEFVTEGNTNARQVQNQPIYAAMMQSLDESVGRVLDKLKELGLDKNTVIIFTSDNGGLSTAEGAPTSNMPLRAGKGWPYEGGVREPLVVKWPGVTKAASVSDHQVMSTDYYPTLLEIAGLPARPEQHLDGISFTPALRGKEMGERPLFWHYPHYSNQGGAPSSSIRKGDWKLIEWYEENRIELFNLRLDVGEKNDLASTSALKREELKSELQAWRASVKADMPLPNPNFDPKADGPFKRKILTGK
ncbi:sulfatase [Pedosphaera parvula]|nr:sulfatase [Pedosphaera parvula]